MTVRNASENPLPRIALQISSTLTWESVSVQGSALPRRATSARYGRRPHGPRARVDPYAAEAACAGRERLTLDAFYSGTIAANGERLERLGAPSSQALETDWDAITSGWDRAARLRERAVVSGRGAATLPAGRLAAFRPSVASGWITQLRL